MGYGKGSYYRNILRQMFTFKMKKTHFAPKLLCIVILNITEWATRMTVHRISGKKTSMSILYVGVLQLSGKASGLLQQTEGHRFVSCWEYLNNFSSEPPLSLTKKSSFSISVVNVCLVPSVFNLEIGQIGLYVPHDISNWAISKMVWVKL